MMYAAEKRHRRSIRLQDHDYALPGAYFVTICTQERHCLFGEVVDTKMLLNDAGRMVQQWWLGLNRKFGTAKTDEFVIMPNHLHGIVVIPVGADRCVGPVPQNARTAHPGAHAGAPLPTIIQWFKTMTTNQYIRGVKTSAWLSFNRRLWQRNYYEHVIRNEESLNRIRQYIQDNPANWAHDRENPAATKPEAEEAWLA